MTVHRSGANTHVRRDLIAGIFLDRAELVIHGADTHEILRLHTDRLLVSRFAAAFERFDLPWRGTTDPFESSFTTWVDKDPRLDASAHEDLRTRARALADKRPGTAEHAREALRSRGISVRDRDGNQQYRMHTDDDPA